MLFAPYIFVMVLVPRLSVPLLVLCRETVEHAMHDAGSESCQAGHLASPEQKPSTGKLCSVKVRR